MLAIRVTRPCLDLVTFFNKLEERCTKAIFYQHDESGRVSRTHIHGLIVGCQVSTDTLKNWIKADVGAINKTDWSFVTKDVNEQFITYMSKGLLEPAYNKGYTEEEIYNYRTAWVDKPKKQTTLTQYRVISEKPETARQRQNDMLQPVIDYFTENPKEFGSRNVVQEIVKVIRKHKIVVGRYKIRDFFDYVMATVKGEAHQSWIDEIHSMCVKI